MSNESNDHIKEENLNVLNPNVICIHIGARAHYLIPISLEQKGALRALITDSWVASNGIRQLLARMPVTSLKSMAGRHSASIPSAKVHSFGIRFLMLELFLRLTYTYSWKSTLLRDHKFEEEALKKMKGIADAEVVLGFSYTALNCFKYARSKGIKTVLYQMDPGIEEELLVADLIQKSSMVTTWERAPKSYWDQWRKECALADVIFVNSEWSKKAMIKHGIEKSKIEIIALPYSIEKKHLEFKKNHPTTYTKQRPLRCLFLGTLALRKGVHLVIEAAKQMVDCPIEFILVGRNEIDLSEFAVPNIQYRGIVTRDETDMAYQQADVFLFPTFSDGFGLTQLEAMAWQLPVISTEFCGAVVEHGKNGWVMQHPDVISLVTILKAILVDPDVLPQHANQCLDRVRTFSTESFVSALSKIINGGQSGEL